MRPLLTPLSFLLLIGARAQSPVTPDSKVTDAFVITRMVEKFHVQPRPPDKAMSAAIYGKKDVPKLTDFYVKSAEFEKQQKSMESKGNSRTKEDVDAHNKAVKDINSAVKSFNETNQKVNGARTAAVNDFNATEKKFADDHMPHYR